MLEELKTLRIIMNYVIFDDRFATNFYPLTLNRSTGDLRVGVLKLRQRIAAYLEIEQPALIVSSGIAPLYRERHPDWQINKLRDGDTVFINSRLKIDDEWLKKIRKIPENSAYTDNDTLLVARLKATEQELSAQECERFFSGLKETKLGEGNSWEYLWEMIAHNAEFIQRDFEDFFYEQDNFFETEMGVTVLNPYNVWIGEGTEMKPGVVIDASDGPVIIDEGVRIMSNSVVIGPVYIGKKSLIKAGAKIYPGTSIGPVCKIGGEVEASIFQGYSNKQHDGFLGHSYLGEWINLGANTNNSDLKNNYKQVKAYFYPLQKKIETDQQFLGTIIGDHTKTGISCVINTGTLIGFGCNLYGTELLTDHIPSFSWGTGTSLVSYDPEAFLQTAEAVKQRRGISLTDTEKEFIKSLISVD